MNVGKTVAIASLVLGLSACTTLQSARDRLVKTPARCVDQTVQIYFEPDSAEVTSEGRAVIKAASDGARGCNVAAVEVLGLADAVGAADVNMQLSKRRAQSVTAALASAGLPDAEFKVSAAGQAGAVTAEGQTRPLRRRVDVTLRVAAAK